MWTDGRALLLGQPSRTVSVAVSAVLVVLWGALRVVVFPNFVLPLTYVLPLLVCIWTRDVPVLWGMAGAFAVLQTIKMFWVLPADALSPGAFQATYITTLVNIAVASAVVHLVIVLRHRLEAALAAARAATERIRAQAADLQVQGEELRAQAEELAGQNAELEQQAVELSEQTEELAQQNEELQAQSEEIQALNDELAERTGLLQRLLGATRVSATEESALEQICASAREMFSDVEAAVLFELQDDRLVLRAKAGVADGQWPQHVERGGRFADLVLRENRTAALNDAALRPDLVVLEVPGAVAWRAALAAPLRVHGATGGVLAVYGRQAREWTDHEFRLIEWLAHLAARTLEMLRLQRDLRRRAALIDLMPGAVIVRALDGTITFWSAGACSLYGYSTEEAIGRRSYELLQTRWPVPWERIESTLRGRGEWSGQLVHRAKDGREVIVESRWSTHQSSDGAALEVLETTVDVTERQRAADALKVSEARFRQLAEAMPNLVWTCAPDGRCDYLNPQWSDYTGTPVERQLDYGWLDQVHPEDRDRILAAWTDAVGQVTAFEGELRIRRHDGTYRWFKARASCQRDERGAIVKWVGANADIEDIRAAEQVLRDVDRRRSEFLATLSHELRNPLAAIRYALAALGRGNGRNADTVPVIERQLAHLVRLVDDLLDITRIGSNKFQLRKRRVDIAAAIGQGVEAARPAIDEGRHACTVVAPPGRIHVDADPDRVAQAVTNLLHNAARYTPPGGRISVSTTTTNGEVEICVRDSGVGLRREDLGRVFDMFTQLGDPGRGGLGIGLALVKAVVEAHGGRVEARSDGEGHGSAFLMYLPLHVTAAEHVETAPPDTIAESPQAPRRVLVVDDNADAADMMKVALEVHGHAVRVAYDARSALDLLPEFTPEIALLDIGLPDIDGYQLARALRTDARSKDAFLVAVTGWGQEEDRVRARAEGFDAHVTKPADLETIARLIADARPVGRDSEPV